MDLVQCEQTWRLMLIWERLGHKKCTGQGYHTTLTIIGYLSHPRSGRRANGILFSFIVNFTTYVKSLIHECFVCNSPWKRQLSIELLCDRNTKSRVRRIVFTVERSSSFHTGQRKRRRSKQRATSWHSRGGVTNSYNWNGVEVRTLLMLFSKTSDKRVSTKIFQRY